MDDVFSSDQVERMRLVTDGLEFIARTVAREFTSEQERDEALRQVHETATAALGLLLTP